jgi:uncharacterized protein YjiS (DUF1127 family)
MSTTHFADAQLRPATRTPVLWPAIWAWAAGVTAGWRIRRAERELHALNDRFLHDMGLTRSEIARAVRGHHRTND